ncbi:hypothetical protein DITRI_Ditri02bG0036600 [Diplodiscus trichospermus]
MKSNGTEPNVFMYSSLADSLCKYGRSSEAMDLVDKWMKLQGLQPNAGLYRKIGSGFYGNLQNAAHLINEMVIDGCIPEEGAWCMLLGVFGIKEWSKKLLYCFKLRW